MLALKEFRLDENADEFLYIVGKNEDSGSKNLKWLGFDPTTELRCDSKKLLFKTANMRKGQVNMSVPNSAITAITTGFHKPIPLFILGIVLLFAGLVVTIIGLLDNMEPGPIVVGLLLIVFAVVALSYYYKNKSILFGVYNGGVFPIVAIYVGKSTVNGVKIGFELYQKAADLLLEAVLESRNPKP